MRRILIALVITLFAASMIGGCTAKESSDDDSKIPAATKEAEAMDTTSLDSAMVDTAATTEGEGEEAEGNGE